MAEPNYKMKPDGNKDGPIGCITVPMCIISGLLYYWLSGNHWAIVLAGGLVGSMFGLIFWFYYDAAIYSGGDEGCIGCLIIIPAVLGISVISGLLAYIFNGNRLVVTITGLSISLFAGLVLAVIKRRRFDKVSQ